MHGPFPALPSLVRASAPELRPPSSMWWRALPVALLVGATVWGDSTWLLQDLDKLPTLAEQVSARIEAVRTALAAGAGVGAAVTLLLAVRRQRHQELATAHTTHDATERRTSELYTKAADQLGSDRAPVRLAGLYALERLGEHTPALQQRVVDVICAYLRMPFTAPAKQDRHVKIRAAQRAARAGAARPTADHGRQPHEERQVRLTAARILANHLRYQPPPVRRWWQLRRASPNARHWPGIRLDLNGATLISLDLRGCRVSDAGVGSATFTFQAAFGGARFTGTAWFAGVTFTHEASFKGATFIGTAWFNQATFTREAEFNGVTFTGDADFFGVTFTGDVGFGEATFTGGAEFSEATFAGRASFNSVSFTGDARFDGAAGLEQAELHGVRVTSAEGVTLSWPPEWLVEKSADDWQTLRLAAGVEGTGAAGGGPVPKQGD